VSSPVPPRRPYGLKNLGNTCYQNAVIQNLLNLNLDSLRSPQIKPGSLSFSLLTLSESKALSTASRFRELLKNPLWLNYEQQDALEFLLSVLDQIHDESLISKTWVETTFTGLIESHTVCTKCKTKSIKSDNFTVLTLPCKNSLSKSLASFLETEILTSENRFDCELTCKSKTDASKTVYLSKLPKILILCLKRFSYVARTGKCEKNRDLIDCEFKLELNNKHYELVGTIDHIGKYIDGGHYIGKVRDVRNIWFECDDENIKEISDPINSNNYILFYHES
jgi:ubiquitin carboxyl-terminal hydrolase 36/42